MKNKKVVFNVIGFGAFFLSGALIGLAINISKPVLYSGMDKEQCIQLSKRIDEELMWNHYDSLEKLSKIYSENCAMYKHDKQKAKPNKSSESACEIVEEILVKKLNCKESSKCSSTQEHYRDAETYVKLFFNGCENNSDKYKTLALRELDVAKALNLNGDYFDYQDILNMSFMYKRLNMKDEAMKLIESVHIYSDGDRGEADLKNELKRIFK